MDIITNGDSPKTYFGKRCKCSRCGIVEVCRTSFDFYTRTQDELGPLFCYPCLLADANERNQRALADGYVATKFEIN